MYINYNKSVGKGGGRSNAAEQLSALRDEKIPSQTVNSENMNILANNIKRLVKLLIYTFAMSYKT